ncbi:MAG TPA: sulfotransferase [Candidatus Angelobacter sp.]|nr:sulfotransferase [Candidatus Angelobacter sp.]
MNDFAPSNAAPAMPEVRLAAAAAAGEIPCHDLAVTVPDQVHSLPSFFIVGPPRTGTTWLHSVLDGHTLLPGPTKETRFFDVHFQRGLSWYLRHYPRPAEGRRVGEVAPTYFASPEARERILRSVPNARVVCSFRNPVQRLVSLYRMKRAYGMIPWSLEEAIDRDPELLESSRYSSNLKAWRSASGADNVLATIYDDLKLQPQSYVDKLLAFIGAPPLQLTDAQVHHVHGSDAMTEPRNYYLTRTANSVAEWLKVRGLDECVAWLRNTRLKRLLHGSGTPFSKVPPQLVRRLCEVFRPDIDELEGLLNRDLSAWKSPDGCLAERLSRTMQAA